MLDKFGQVLRRAADQLRALWDRKSLLENVQEQHLHKAFGERPGTRAKTPIWPIVTSRFKEEDLIPEPKEPEAPA